MRKRSEYTKITIIAVAKEMFLSKGYVGTSIDDVAKEVGTTKKTIYSYFKDKDALFSAVVDDSTKVAWDTVISDSKIEDLDSLYLALYSIANDINNILIDPNYVKLFRVVISEINNRPDLEILIKRGIGNHSYIYLRKIFKKAIDLKLINVTNPDLCAKMFVGGFLTNVFLDGLLNPELKKLKRLSQTEIIEYISILTTKAKPIFETDEV